MNTDKYEVVLYFRLGGYSKYTNNSLVKARQWINSLFRQHRAWDKAGSMQHIGRFNRAEITQRRGGRRFIEQITY